MKRIVSLALATLALAACQSDPVAPVTPAGAPSRSLAASGRVTRGAADIPGQYVVLLRAGARSDAQSAAAMVASERGRVRHVYGAINGFAVDLADTSAAKLAHDPNVLAVVPDEVITATASGTETSAPWGLDRIDQKALPLNGTYAYGTDGTGVTVYIVDTGINYSHVDFGGRATAGYDAVTTGGGAVDCNGHGTHVAGTVGGTKYGVAKAAKLVGVRVLDCSGSGSSSGVIAGLDWVLQQKQANPTRPMVVNMSLGGGVYSALDSAVSRLTSAGVTVAVAAGNSTVDACTQSPARAASAITVGATGSNDAFATFSNYGSCVDISAPGVSITSDYYTSTTATATMSGTSMASPHVAGVAALYLSANPSATAAQVASALASNATPNAITGLPANTVNKLLNVQFIGGSATTNQPPVARFTWTCVGMTYPHQCAFDGSTSTDDNGVVTWKWTWGNGTGETKTVPATKKTFAAAGTYTVTLTVTGASGLTNSASQVVTVP